MTFILSNLSDEKLEELDSAVYNERRRRWLEKSKGMSYKDDPSLSRVERIKFIKENNPGMSLSAAFWIVQSDRL